MDLLERGDELSVLDDVLARAKGGDGRVALLTGPPGIGKTALLAAVRQRAGPGMRALTAVGGQLDRDLPFGVVRQLLESTVHASTGDDDVLSGAADLAAPVFALGKEHRAIAALGDVVHGLYWLCSNLAEKLPLLLAIDDVHWADEASLRFLSHLARRIEGLPILVLAAGRTGPVLDDVIMRVFGGVEVVAVQIAPLTPLAVSKLVRRRLGADADDAFCTACAVASGGNPFLLTEAIDTLNSDDVRPLASEVARVERLRPQTITRAVLSRVARLGPEAVRFVRALAILGAHCQPRQHREFADLSPEAMMTIVDALARDSILATGHPADFVHPLVREAVYGDMSATRRAAEHKRAAHLLEASGANVEQVATQLLATDPESDEWVVAMLRRGAAAALARGAPESAVTLLTRAREEPPPLEELASLDAELARGLAMAGRLTEATRLFREAIDHTEDQFAKLVLALELVVALHRSGRSQEAVQAVHLARGFVAWDDPDLPAPLQAVLAAADFVAMEPPSVWTARLDRVTARNDSTGALDRTVLAIQALGAAAMGDRPASEVERLARRAATGAVPRQDSGTLVVMAGSALAISGRMAEALVLFDAGIDNARALGNRSEFRYLAVVRSRVARLAGQLVEAEADARGALNEVTGEPRTLNTTLAAAVLIDALVERGAIIDAAGIMAAFELDRQPPGNAMIDHFVPMARGALRLAEHKPAEALQDFLECGQLLTAHGYTNPGFADWRAGAVAAHVALGEVTAAAALATENLERARAFEAPGAIALALRMAARAATTEARLRYLAEAANLLANAPAMLERAHVLVEYGAELCRVGNKTAARTPLRHGLDIAAQFDAQPLVVTAQRELRLIGLRPRRPATTGPDSLTASELRVASLAAEGATNRQIAQTLFVTTRTVEVHLTNAYRKLAIQNRDQLGTALTKPRPMHDKTARSTATSA